MFFWMDQLEYYVLANALRLKLQLFSNQALGTVCVILLPMVTLLKENSAM